MEEKGFHHPPDRADDSDAHTHTCTWCGEKWRCISNHSNGKNPTPACFTCRRLTFADLFARYPDKDPLSRHNQPDRR